MHTLPWEAREALYLAMLPNRESVLSKAWAPVSAIPLHALSVVEPACMESLPQIKLYLSLPHLESHGLVAKHGLASGFLDA